MRARDFREKARAALSGKWFIAVIAGMIASMFGAAGGGVTFSFENDFNIDQMPGSGAEAIFSGNVNYWPIMFGTLLFVVICAAISLVLGSVISVGYAEFNLDLDVGFYNPRISSLFAHFGRTKTAVGASLLVFLRVFIGSIFFIIPGIIAAYKYSMVYYVLAENPYITAADALEKSKELMRFNKWRLFCLDLSFIGWDLLSIITFGIASLWVTPYHQAARTAFYHDISSPEASYRW
ncbi:MAG: DUF975 family protein [Clostridia bacterium]|nr:DUF975 family protein [Clostridia bacterium]